MSYKCSQCGLCCSLFLINLTKEECQSGKYKTQFEEFGLIDDFNEASKIGGNFLKQKEDGSCVYLNDNKCSIHQTRPQVCKEFFCSSKKKRFQGMIRQIEKKRTKSF